MCLAFDHQDGTATTLVDPTVFSIGADDRYIVLRQHPKTDSFGNYDRSVTHYFIVERTNSPSFDDRKRLVRGPLTRQEFEKLPAAQSLPWFNKTFDDLE